VRRRRRCISAQIWGLHISVLWLMKRGEPHRSKFFPCVTARLDEFGVGLCLLGPGKAAELGGGRAEANDFGCNGASDLQIGGKAVVFGCGRIGGGAPECGVMVAMVVVVWLCVAPEISLIDGLSAMVERWRWAT
jgi:hypothetical protein